jgi:hypothetical protein
MSFTPGPWRHSKHSNIGNLIEGPSGQNLFEGDDGYRSICTVGSCTSSTRYDDKEANQAANIRLIAAAPDMLKALQEVYEFMKLDIASGDDALWSKDYQAIFDTVESSIEAVMGRVSGEVKDSVR